MFILSLSKCSDDLWMFFFFFDFVWKKNNTKNLIWRRFSSRFCFLKPKSIVRVISTFCFHFKDYCLRRSLVRPKRLCSPQSCCESFFNRTSIVNISEPHLTKFVAIRFLIRCFQFAVEIQCLFILFRRSLKSTVNFKVVSNLFKSNSNCCSSSILSSSAHLPQPRSFVGFSLFFCASWP